MIAKTLFNPICRKMSISESLSQNSEHHWDSLVFVIAGSMGEGLQSLNHRNRGCNWLRIVCHTPQELYVARHHCLLSFWSSIMTVNVFLLQRVSQKRIWWWALRIMEIYQARYRVCFMMDLQMTWRQVECRYKSPYISTIPDSAHVRLFYQVS